MRAELRAQPDEKPPVHALPTHSSLKQRWAPRMPQTTVSATELPMTFCT